VFGTPQLFRATKEARIKALNSPHLAPEELLVVPTEAVSPFFNILLSKYKKSALLNAASYLCAKNGIPP